jgi:hypothetical protein
VAAKEKTQKEAAQVIALALLSLVLVAATSLPAPPTEQLATHEQDRSGGAGQTKEGGSSVPPLGESGSTKPSAESSKQPTCNYYCNAASSEWTFATLIQLLSAAAVAFFTFGLWRTSVSQWRAISESNQVGRDSLHLAHRPWLVTDNMEIKEVAEAGSGESSHQMAKFEVHLVNCGSTPALRIKTTIGWCFLDISAPIPPNPAYDPPRVRVLETGIIGPGRPMVHFDWIDETVDGKRKFAELIVRKRLYVYGIIKYEGSFNRPEPYVTTFCYLKDPYNANGFTMIGPYNSAA